MTQTFALLLDSYRELNAKRLFWIVLAVSGLAVAAVASIGLAGGSVTLLGWRTPLHLPLLALVSQETFYKQLYVTFGIDIWLSWLAAILALVSTAGIFPDLMAGGSIDLYLSKPISRPRLFLTKAGCGLLFVTLQVAVFSACCFVVLRVRAGVWLPGVFLAVPLVVLMFSYLFAVCVLVGVVTRSTVAALLLTLVFWFVAWGLARADALVSLARTMEQQRVVQIDRQITTDEADLAAFHDGPATTRAATRPTDDEADDAPPPPPAGHSIFAGLFGGTGGRRSRSQLASDLTRLRAERQAASADPYGTAHAILAGLVAPLPKTSDTIELLERRLITAADLPPVAAPAQSDAELVGPPDGPNARRRGRRGEQEYQSRQLDLQRRQSSAAWTLGTSCLFEAAVLGLAAWWFCRRDY